MALPATLVWEIRPTNGTTNAGGGFDPSVASPGTDRSQQNAVQTAYTDLVLATTTTLTSAANPFGAADVGNNICITGGSGFTTGIYNIRSVSVVTATIDRAGGTASSTGGTGNLGGARSGFTVGTNTVQAALVAGNKAWVKNEAWNEGVAFTVAGTPTSPITIEGYNTSRGDAPTGANIPTNDRASAGGIAIDNSGANYFIKYIRARRSTAAGFNISASSVAVAYIGCRADNNTTAGFSRSAGNPLISYINCEADSNTTNGISNGAAAGNIIIEGCYVHDNTTSGISLSTTTTGIVLNTISEANASHGIQCTTASAMYLFNVTLDGNTGASTDGFSFTTPGFISWTVMNCIFSNNGRDGARGTQGNSILSNYNDFYSNAGTARTNFPTGANDVTSDPTFTNRASGDFSIGTNLKGIGAPGVFPGGLSTGYNDIGAVQRQESSGGSGSSVTFVG